MATTFHLFNFGCRASQADGAALKKQLLDAGLKECKSLDQSQVAVVNTCTVTAAADAEVRQVIRRIHRANPSCRILVTGCYAQRAPEEIAQLAGVTWVIGNSHKHGVAELLRAFCTEGPRSSMGAQRAPRPEQAGSLTQFVQIQAGWRVAEKRLPRLGTKETSEPAHTSFAQVLVGEIPDRFHFAPVFPDDRTRPTLKVQDGCNARCSFCIIPEVRGRSRSLAPEKVIEQVRDLVANGYKEIVLSGINLGSYGKDLDRRITFLGLLERTLDETSIARLRISSIEPMDVSPELIRLVAQKPRLAQHFHVPLQSGCDRILRLMKRRYWTAQYAERILSIREQIPDCGIGADVMVGFPGETEVDHESSVRLIESLPFTYLHIFPYSPRPGTPAAAMAHQVPAPIARVRSQEIRCLIGQKRQAFLHAQVDRVLSVLTLDESDQENRMALSSNYLKVALPHSNAAANTLLSVRVGRVGSGLLYAYPEMSKDGDSQGFASHLHG